MTSALGALLSTKSLTHVDFAFLNFNTFLKGTYQGFSFFIANSFYKSDFMYLLRTPIIFHNVQW